MLKILAVVALGAAVLALTSCAKTGNTPSRAPATQAATQTVGSEASLAEAVEAWVALLESGNLPDACERWTKDDEAAQRLTRWWDRLRECHKQYDYRNWVEKAQHVSGDSFKVGGHEYGYMHTDWERTPQGWRIARVYVCR